MGDNHAADPAAAENQASRRLRAALAERRRVDAALRAAVHAATAPGPAAGGAVDGGQLAAAIAHAVPGLAAEDVALAAAAAGHQLAAAEPDTSSTTTPEPPAQPPIPPVVLLRGAGVDSGTFDRVHAALRARGMWTLTDRTRAMHLSRGGLSVWMLDFSTSTGGAAAAVSIAQVRAVFQDAPGGKQQLQLTRLHAYRVDRPTCAGELDASALADQVAAAMLTPPPHG